MTQEVFDKAVELPVRESDGRTISEWTHKLQVAETIFRVENHGLAVLDWPPPFYTPFRTQMPSDINIKLFHKRKLPLPPSEAKLLFNGSPHWQLFDAQDPRLHSRLAEVDGTRLGQVEAFNRHLDSGAARNAQGSHGGERGRRDPRARGVVRLVGQDRDYG